MGENTAIPYPVLRPKPRTTRANSTLMAKQVKSSTSLTTTTDMMSVQKGPLASVSLSTATCQQQEAS